MTCSLVRSFCRQVSSHSRSAFLRMSHMLRCCQRSPSLLLLFRSAPRSGRFVSMSTRSLMFCGEVEDVVGALTPVISAVAQVFHHLLVELRLLLVAEWKRKTDRRKAQREREWNSSSQKETTIRVYGMEMGRKEQLNVSVMTKDCETCRFSACCVMRHAIVEVRCVNVVIGVDIVVLSVPLVVVRVVPIFLAVIQKFISFASCSHFSHKISLYPHGIQGRRCYSLPPLFTPWRCYPHAP